MVTRIPDHTPNPEILEALRRQRGEPPVQGGTAPQAPPDAPAPVQPASPPPTEPPRPQGPPPGAISLNIVIPPEQVGAVLDGQAMGLYNTLARSCVESNAHGSVIIYVLELLRTTMLTKERIRIGFPGARPPATEQKPGS